MPTNDDVPIIGQMRRRGYRRVTHGGFLTRVEGLSAHEELRRDLSVWLALLPDDAVFTHVTGAELLGWKLPPLPAVVPVFAAVVGDRRPRRPGLICSRLRRESRPRYVHGLPVDSAEEILLRLARDFEHLDMVIVIESALQAGDVDTKRMETLLASRRPGVVVLRGAWAASTGKAGSVAQAVHQTCYRVLRIPFEPQKHLHDAAGRLCGVVDLYVPPLDEAHEIDGEGDRDQVRNDRRPEPGPGRIGVRRRGFTLDALLNHAAVVMHELDRDLGRPHRPELLRRWRAMVEHSLYSTAGQERMVNRWHRAMGVSQWSRSA